MDILDNAKDERGAVPMRLVRQAFDKLVQPEESTEKRTETHACDLISRQAAIDALWKALCEYEDKTEKQFQESDELDVGDWILHRIFVQNMSDIDRRTILELPPAHPEERTEKRTGTHACDLIDRQAAIDAIHNLYAIHGSEGSWIDQRDAFNAVNNLPSAQPEPKKGEWVEAVIDSRYVTCSCCKENKIKGRMAYTPAHAATLNYCPNCGAKMEEKQNE